MTNILHMTVCHLSMGPITFADQFHAGLIRFISTMCGTDLGKTCMILLTDHAGLLTTFKDISN